jgi:hypothetical protein
VVKTYSVYVIIYLAGTFICLVLYDLLVTHRQLRNNQCNTHSAAGRRIGRSGRWKGHGCCVFPYVNQAHYGRTHARIHTLYWQFRRQEGSYFWNYASCGRDHNIHSFIQSFSRLSYNRSKASSKASSPQSAIQSFLLQMRVPSHLLKVIQ